MQNDPDIASVAALIGEPARARMLTALMSGKALTATELAHEAGITVQTASAHLGKLADGGLIALRRQGRHKYFSLGGGEVAHVLESLMGLASGQLRTRTGPKDAAMRRARVCYNHLAGDLSTRLFDSLVARDFIVRRADALELSAAGESLVTEFGIDVAGLRAGRAPLCRACLDWSERKSHLAGSLGRAFLTRFTELGWTRRVRDSRVVQITPPGEQGLRKLTGARFL